jgi:hypothetical protein
MRGVYCFDLDKEYRNAVDASRDTGVCRSSITKACNNTRATAGGMLWSYSNNKTIFEKVCRVK